MCSVDEHGAGSGASIQDSLSSSGQHHVRFGRLLASIGRITSTNDPELKDSITLDILTAVREDSSVTQRTLADQLGIALGLTNFYLKRCVQKGLIKITSVPANRYSYYLTPKGFAEKSRLTREYLFESFKYFRAARQQFGDIFHQCVGCGQTKILLAGASDLSEIAVLCSQDKPVELIGIFQPGAKKDREGGIETFSRLPNVTKFDVVIICDIEDPIGLYQQLSAKLEASRILAPDLLGELDIPLRLVESTHG